MRHLYGAVNYGLKHASRFILSSGKTENEKCPRTSLIHYHITNVVRCLCTLSFCFYSSPFSSCMVPLLPFPLLILPLLLLFQYHILLTTHFYLLFLSYPACTCSYWSHSFPYFYSFCSFPPFHRRRLGAEFGRTEKNFADQNFRMTLLGRNFHFDAENFWWPCFSHRPYFVCFCLSLLS